MRIESQDITKSSPRSAASKGRWGNPEIRTRIITGLKNAWADNQRRADRIESRNKSLSEKNCSQCKRPFVPTGTYQLYCANCKTEAYRKQNRDAHYRNGVHVSDRELERLRLSENVLEALTYGPEKKCVCLNCGLTLGDLSRHTSACPVKPQPSSGYRKEWGYNKSNPLATSECHERDSQSHKDSPRAQRARKANETIWRSAFAAEASRGPRPNRRGPLREEARRRRSVPRPGCRKFSDEQLLAHLPGLTVSETAELLGVDPSSVSARARKLGLETDAYHRQQRIVSKVLSAVRRHYRRAPLPDSNQIIGWCGGHLPRNSRIPGEFKPFFWAFSHALTADVIECLIKELGVGYGDQFKGLFALAARILRHYRAAIASRIDQGRGRPSKKQLYLEAKELRDQGMSYPEIARRLTKAEYAAKGPRKAGEAIRQGIKRLMRI